jgi:hypothetical protein
LSKLALTNNWFAAQLSELELLTKVWQTPLVQNEDLALVGTAVVVVVGVVPGAKVVVVVVVGRSVVALQVVQEVVVMVNV